jgi:hypothetical protein
MLADVSSICLTMPLHGEVDLINIALFFFKFIACKGFPAFLFFFIFLFMVNTHLRCNASFQNKVAFRKVYFSRLKLGSLGLEDLFFFFFYVSSEHSCFLY